LRLKSLRRSNRELRGQLFENELSEAGRAFGVPRLPDALSEDAQRLLDFSDDLNVRDVMGGDLRRKGIDVDDASSPPWVPRPRIVLHEIIPDADHEVGLVES